MKWECRLALSMAKKAVKRQNIAELLIYLKFLKRPLENVALDFVKLS